MKFVTIPTASALYQIQRRGSADGANMWIFFPVKEKKFHDTVQIWGKIKLFNVYVTYSWRIFCVTAAKVTFYFTKRKVIDQSQHTVDTGHGVKISCLRYPLSGAFKSLLRMLTVAAKMWIFFPVIEKKFHHTVQVWGKIKLFNVYDTYSWRIFYVTAAKLTF